MNPEAQEEFNRIVELTPDELNIDEKGFLFARRDYMNGDQEKKFSNVIKEMQALSDKKLADEEAEAKKKESKN